MALLNCTELILSSMITVAAIKKLLENTNEVEVVDCQMTEEKTIDNHTIVKAFRLSITNLTQTDCHKIAIGSFTTLRNHSVAEAIKVSIEIKMLKEEVAEVAEVAEVVAMVLTRTLTETCCKLSTTETIIAILTKET